MNQPNIPVSRLDRPKEPSPWVKNKFTGKKEPWFIDGDTFVIAVWVVDNSKNKAYWQIDKVVADCNGENFYLKTPEGESYDDWQWEDVDYFIPVDAIGPMTRKQIEDFL